MGVVEDLRRRYLVRRLAQGAEEAVEHPGVGPHGPYGAGAALLLGLEGVDGLVPAASVTTLDQILRRHGLLPWVTESRLFTLWCAAKSRNASPSSAGVDLYRNGPVEGNGRQEFFGGEY